MMSPFSSKSCVIPIFFPIMPIMRLRSFQGGAHPAFRGIAAADAVAPGSDPDPHSAGARAAAPSAGPRGPASSLDLDVDARRDVELLQRFHGLARGPRDVDEPLVNADLELLARLLVH